MPRPSNRALRRWVLAGAVVVGAVAARGFAWTRPPEGTGGGSPRGLILLCIDSLRADAVSRPDALPGPMPRLQGLAREATMFVDASSPSAWTAPSIGSLLTGLLPSKHGVRGDERESAVAPSIVTLGETLGAAGWYTAASTGGGWVGAEQGLAQGFQKFDTSFDDLGPEFVIGSWDQARPKDRPFFLFLHTAAARDPYGLRAWMRRGESALRHAAPSLETDLQAGLDRAGGRLPDELRTPFCLQHLTNPKGRLACTQALGAAKYDALWRSCRPWVDGGYAEGGDRASIEADVRDAYRAGLSATDEIVGDVLKRLRSQGLLDHADLVVVGNHGEAFGEHRALVHGSNLYDEALRVPLLVVAPRRMPAGRVVRGSCSLLDVVPTALDLAGLPVPPGLDGQSLVPLSRDEARGRPVVAELDPRVVPGHASAASRLVSVRSEAAKWILTFDPSDGRVIREELYDLLTDPAEALPLDVSDVSPGRFGDAFCRAVTAQRNAVRRAAGLDPLYAPCVTLR